MSKEAMKLALEAAYLAGFNASGEGYNGEYPFGDHARNPEEDAAWIKARDNALREALAEQKSGIKQVIELYDSPDQPAQQQEPVKPDEVGTGCECVNCQEGYGGCQKAQPQYSLEEYDAGLLNDFGGGNVEWWQDYIRAELGRAYEHYQSQMPTYPQQEQQRARVGDSRFESWFSEDFDPNGKGTKQQMREAYEAGMNDTSPPAQRTWVGLTYEEAKEIYTCIHGYDSSKRIARAIEAKLKEKNT